MKTLVTQAEKNYRDIFGAVVQEVDLNYDLSDGVIGYSNFYGAVLRQGTRKVGRKKETLFVVSVAFLRQILGDTRFSYRVTRTYEVWASSSDSVLIDLNNSIENMVKKERAKINAMRLTLAIEEMQRKQANA